MEPKWRIFDLSCSQTSIRVIVCQRRSTLHVHFLARVDVFGTWHTLAYHVITSSFAEYCSLLRRVGFSDAEDVSDLTL